jgi:dihydropteroate synthase
MASARVFEGHFQVDGAAPCGVMGIVNVTPDSFSDGGAFTDVSTACAHGLEQAQAGAEWVDVGGESTRPGADAVHAAEESARVVPVIQALAGSLPSEVGISVDTAKGAVAAQALAAGATMVNDVAGGADPVLLEAVAAADAALCLMHMQGTPRTMQASPSYGDVVAEVIDFLGERVERAVAAGCRREHILVDPGIGFGKTLEHNLALLRSLARIRREVGRPVLVGLSRKSFLPRLLGREVAMSERDALSHCCHALLAGDCRLLRVHDVGGARDALLLARALGGLP